MNRPSTRTLALLAFAALFGGGSATFFGAIEGGCVYGTPEPAETSVCNALAGYFQSCAVSSACNAAYMRDCTKVSAALSETAVNSLFSCAQAGTSCGGAGAAVVSTCAIDGYATNGTPSTAQLQLATDYCRVCAPTESNCAFTFFETGATGTVWELALAGDTTITSVDSTCVPKVVTDAGTAACSAAFTACADPIAAAGFYIPPECISDAGIDAMFRIGDGG
jgi:hypothetical protein